MKKLNHLLTLSAAILVVGLSRQDTAAQPDFGNFDPQQMQQQMQQRMMDNIREQLVITNDADWNAIEPLITKVSQARMASMMGGMGGMRGMMGGRGGGPGGMGGGFPGFGGQPDSDAEALQNAIDANAPAEQIKAALAKYRESRKQKAAELATAQEQLRQVLTLRQEAVMVSMGMLN